jgi:hypothetical protein
MAGDIRTKSRDDAGRLLPGIHIDLALVTMAGFQVTLYGRFWVTPKGAFTLGCADRKSPLGLEIKVLRDGAHAPRAIQDLPYSCFKWLLTPHPPCVCRNTSKLTCSMMLSSASIFMIDA